VINVKGTTGQKYTVNVNVRGVVGHALLRDGHTGVDGRGNGQRPEQRLVRRGQAVQRQHLEHDEIRIAPKVAGQANQTLNTGYDIYFANSFQNSNSSAAGTAQWWCQREATYEVGYNASFPVMGGGTITLVTPRFELPGAPELRGHLESADVHPERLTHHQHVRRVTGGAGELPAAALVLAQRHDLLPAVDLDRRHLRDEPVTAPSARPTIDRTKQVGRP
jgi:hypothetical protein